MRLRPTLLATIAAILLEASAFGREVPRSEAIDRIMQNALAEWEIPGAAVAIVEQGSIAHLKGYGTRASGAMDPVTPDTLFGIGSTTKAFTSAAVAMLVGEGTMSWDDPVRKHLPWFQLSDPCADASVTMRDILSHRTGLTRHDALWDNSPWSREEIIRRIGQIKLTRPFRSAYHYQNIMFIAAGEAVGAATGSNWDSFIASRILGPLGMSRTRLSGADARAVPDHATGHFKRELDSKVEVFPPIDDTNVGPAGSIHSSARDMSRWVAFQLTGGKAGDKQLVDAEALEETKRPQTIIPSSKESRESNPETNFSTYGLGWNVIDYRGEIVVSHGGALNGFRAVVTLVPGRNSGFVVLHNLGRSSANVAIRNALLDVLLGAKPEDWNAFYLADEKKESDEERKKKNERLAKRPRNTRPSLELEAYAGRYTSPGYGDAEVSFEGGSLVLRWSRLTLPLRHLHFDTFLAESALDFVEEDVVFHLDAEAEIARVEFLGQQFEKNETKPE